MALSSEAFKKFSTWNRDNTSLNVTVIERGKPEENLLVQIGGVDENASLIGVVGKVMHSWANFDVGEANFSIELRRVVVSREDVEWLIFEECL